MKTSSKQSQSRLFEIAEGQGGFFTAQQAADAGFDRTHHSYHVQAGNWQREYRGIFRLARFPLPERPDLILWSLWSRNRLDQPEGVYSHQTALSIHGLSDLMPARLHLTVPKKFRRSAPIPSILVLHHENLPLDQVEEHEGFRVTRPLQTMLDIIRQKEIPNELIGQAFSEAMARGLITGMDIEEHRDKLPAFLFAGRCWDGRQIKDATPQAQKTVRLLAA